MSDVMKAYKDRVVRSLYATTDTHIIAEMLGEDATAVRNRAARLGIKKPIVAADTLLPPEKQAILVNTMLELSVKIITYWEMCTSWNEDAAWVSDFTIITYWEMCTSWNQTSMHIFTCSIITYWEMCTSWNPHPAQS